MGTVFKKHTHEIIEKKKNTERHTIMLVDDEPHMLRSLAALFADEYKIITARNGKDAIEHVRKMEEPEKISLILCDQKMPGLSGIELLRRLKEYIPNTIRIILTAYSDISVLIAAVNEAKIYEFIQKEFEPEDLKLRVKRAIEAYERQQQLDEYHRVLEKKTRELKEANRLKNLLFSSITHDLRDPMQVSLGFLNLLSSNYDSFSEEKRKELIGKVLKNHIHILDILEEFLKWILSQMGKIKCHPDRVDLNTLVSESFELIMDNAEQKNISLTSNLTCGNIAFADPNMIRSVLVNLINNAIKFTDSGSQIIVDANVNKDRAEVSVCVNRGGMDEGELRGFLNGEGSPKGTGSGLLLCKQFIEMNNGKFDAINLPEKGTCFKFTLPRNA